MSSLEPAKQPSGTTAPVPGIVSMDDPKPYSTASSDATTLIQSIEGMHDTEAYNMGTWSERVGPPNPLILLLVLSLLQFFRSRTQDHNANSRIRQFVSSRGNEYFCEIDEEYLTDRFNLTGLNTEVHYYQHALDLVNDVFDLDCDDEMREAIEKSARHLYGLVHARYIVTTRGLAKMVSHKHFYSKPPNLSKQCLTRTLLFPSSTNTKKPTLANAPA